MRRKLTLLAIAVALSIGSLSQAQQPQIELDFEVLKKAPENAAVWFQKAVDLQGVAPSSHWMGVVVRPTDPLLKKHLRIEGGLIVQQVTADSPAAEAGIQAEDILLSVNDTAVADFGGLMKFLTDNEDKEVAVKLLREGEEKSLKVTPTKRPAGHEKFFTPPKIGEAFEQFEFQGKTPQEIRKWVEEMVNKGGAGGSFNFDVDGENPLKLRFFHPGVILGEDVDIDVDLDLPKGLQVMITKQGDEPAKIKIKRGDDEWEVTEKDLDKLPEDVRKHVKQYLGKGPRLGIRVETPKVGARNPQDGARLQRILPGTARVQARAIQIDGGISNKLDEINNRLEKIEKALQKLAD